MIAFTRRRHPATELEKFLATIDNDVPGHPDIHVVCDKYGTHQDPAVTTRLTKHSRFHRHFTPAYLSGINQVERLFAKVTRDFLQRKDHRGVQTLEKDLRDWVNASSENPKPYIWTKTAEEIPESLGPLS